MQTKKTVLFLLLTTLLCVLSYYYIDRQLVWFLDKHHSHHLYILHILANQITLVIGIAVCLFYVYIAIRLNGATLSTTEKKLAVVCNSIVTAVFLKNILKTVFARYWPSTFICNNPSLIENHVYGFNWFHKDVRLTSFPSGHASFIFSCSVSLWLLFPRLRWLWSLLTAMVMIGQIGMYYHFVSDVIAGAALGGLVAIYHYRFWAMKA